MQGDTDETFIGAVTAETKKGNQGWAVVVEIQDREITFFADTQADVTVMPEKLFEECFRDVRLREPLGVLYGADNEYLSNVCGFFWEKIGYRGQSVMAEIDVVKGTEKPLLAGDVSESLGVVKRVDVDAIRAGHSSIDPVAQFPKLFQGLGRMKGPYKIRLRDGTVPHALTTPRGVPIPMLKEIKKTLDEMVRMGVIVLVEEPTEWYSGLVTVPKPDGLIRICVDYVYLNKFVKREVHPMLMTENLLERLGKAIFFRNWTLITDFGNANLTRNHSY